MTAGAALLMAILLLVGCQKTTTTDNANEPAAEVNHKLVIAAGDEVTSLDPAFGYDFTQCPISIQIHESLLRYDENDQIQPNLASEWEEVDPTTYRYVVRDDVKFSDGTPMTMDDVLFSIERLRDPELASYVGWMYDNVKDVKQTGDWEFTVTLKSPDALWKHTFATSAGCIVNKAFTTEQGKDYGTLSGKVLGTGPYTLVSWAAAGDVVLTYNPDYWNAQGTTPDVTDITFQTIKDESTRVMAAKTGQVDLIFQTPPDLIGEVKDGDVTDLLTIPADGVQLLAFNCKTAPFDDVNARRAVASAIDIASFQESAIGDFGSPTNYLLVPDTLFTFAKSEWENFQSAAKVYSYDPTAAKQYLADSSYPDGFDFKLAIDADSIENSLALMIQQNLKEIGINCEIDKRTNEEHGSWQFGSDIKDGVRPYQAALFTWATDFPDPSGVINPIVLSGDDGDGGSNMASYANKTVDELLEKQVTLSDDTERTKLMIQALELINDEVPYYVWTHQNFLIAQNKRLTGLDKVLTPFWSWNLKIDQFTLSK
jgi:peptide/nickel transport system substrate-binding protein